MIKKSKKNRELIVIDGETLWHLQPGNSPKGSRSFQDEDYITQLVKQYKSGNDLEREQAKEALVFLNKFNGEEKSGDVSKRDPLAKTKIEKRKVWNRNDARRRDFYGQRWQVSWEDLKETDLVGNEDSLIENIDSKKKIKKK